MRPFTPNQTILTKNLSNIYPKLNHFTVYAEDSKIFQTEMVIAKLRQRARLRGITLQAITTDPSIIQPELPSTSRNF
jgi:hypothetical protein